MLWLKGNAIVAAFEVESTTSIYSGLLRMSDLVAMQPNLNMLLTWWLQTTDEKGNNRSESANVFPPFATTVRDMSVYLVFDVKRPDQSGESHSPLHETRIPGRNFRVLRNRRSLEEIVMQRLFYFLVAFNLAAGFWSVYAILRPSFGLMASAVHTTSRSVEPVTVREAFLRRQARGGSDARLRLP